MVDDEENKDESLDDKAPKDSILMSVKKLLGLTEEVDVFDDSIIMNINAAINVLYQLGVGPRSGYVVTSKYDTYSDWLGDTIHLQNIKMHLYYRTRLGFDPPSSTAVIDVIKESIREIECRLSYQVEVPDSFKQEVR